MAEQHTGLLRQPSMRRGLGQVDEPPKRLPNYFALAVKSHTLIPQQLDLLTRVFSIFPPTSAKATNTAIGGQHPMTWHLGCEGVVPHPIADSTGGGVEEGRQCGIGRVSAARDAAECGVEAFAVRC